MAGPMPHWAPGKRAVTAAAMRCAVLCRKSGNASGLSCVTMRTRASWVNGVVRSTRRSSTNAASAAFASRGEISAATSPGVAPEDTRRLEPSGSVTEMSLIAAVVNGKGSLSCVRLAVARFASFGVQPSRDSPIHPRAAVDKLALACHVAGVAVSERRLVGTGRLELPTSCVSSRRSNQLSYAPIS